MLVYFGFDNHEAREPEISTDEPTKDKEVLPELVQAAENLPLLLDKPFQQTRSAAAKITEIINWPQFTATETIEMNNWLLENGFTALYGGVEGFYDIQQAASTDYDFYSLELLAEIAEADPFAELKLGLRLLLKNRLDEAELYLREAAVNGYAIALLKMYDLHIKLGKKFEKQGLREKADERYIEAYAWQQVYILRFFSDVAREDRSPLKLEPHRLDRVIAESILRGSQIFDDLRSTRKKEGQPEFDNRIPSSFEVLAKRAQG
jgi:hypothetical protein